MERNDNNSESSMVKVKIDFEIMEIGEIYAIKLVSGLVVSGVLVSRIELLTKDGIVKSYRIAFNKSKFVDLEEDEIDFISTVDDVDETYRDRTEYFKEFEMKYGVIILDCDDKLLSNETILREVIINSKLWDEFSDDEKKEFLWQLEVKISDIVKIINMCVETLQENSKLHEEKLKILNQMADLASRIDRIERVFPNMDSAEKLCNFFYKDLGISDLIHLTV